MSKVYQLLDSGNQQKLENVGGIRIIRPAAQAVWKPALPKKEWQAAASFHRNSQGDGKWSFHSKVPESWNLTVSGIQLVIRLTDFGHIGIFPEHHDLVDLPLDELGKPQFQKEKPRVLHLFAYTGVLSLLMAKAGFDVTHVDASRTSVGWGRENAQASGMQDAPVRWIVDDVQKFVEKEIRRGKRYHGIVLDPPSFGRGPKGQVWKLEQHLAGFMEQLQDLLAEDFLFVRLSAHSPGMTPHGLANLLLPVQKRLSSQLKDRTLIKGREMFVVDQSGRPLPSGVAATLRV